LTALTLHLDQEHLLGNLLFGMFAGIAAGRLVGPGMAWASIVGAGALANYAEIIIAPANHRAVGASTAVFAALGTDRRPRMAATAYLARAPLERLGAADRGDLLLTLLGAGTEHVDVLGHGLGFLAAWVSVGCMRGRAFRVIAAGACRSSRGPAPYCC
jgi:rhomboid protease GluP